MTLIPLFRSANSFSVREHRLIYNLEGPNKIDSAAQKKGAAEIKMNAPQEMGAKNIKNASETTDKAAKALQGTMDSVTNSLTSLSANLEREVQLTPENIKQGTATLLSYNREKDHDMERVKAALQQHGFAEPTNDEVEQGHRNAVEGRAISPPLKAGTMISMITGTIQTFKNFLAQFGAKFGMQNNVVTERQKFNNQFAAMQKRFPTTAALSLNSTTRPAVGTTPALTTERLTVTLGASRTPADRETFRKTLGSQGLREGTDFTVDAGSGAFQIDITSANRLARVSTALDSIRTQDDVKTEAAQNKAKVEVNSKVSAAHEAANKPLAEARLRIADGDAQDPLAQEDLKTVQARMKELEAAIKTDDVARMDTAKQALEKAMTVMETTCKIVRKTWGQNYLITNVDATPESTTGDVDKYSKQFGNWFGDYMGMQFNKPAGQWQTGWWNGGRGPMDTPAGGMSFNYARYDQINTTLKNINMHHLKPPTTGLVNANADKLIAERQKKANEQPAKTAEEGKKTAEESGKKSEALTKPTVEAIAAAITSQVPEGRSTSLDVRLPPLGGIRCILQGGNLKIGGRTVRIAIDGGNAPVNAVERTGSDCIIKLQYWGERSSDAMPASAFAQTIMTLSNGITPPPTVKDGHTITMTPGPVVAADA